MKIDKDYWKNFALVEENVLTILCPTCSKGHLRPMDKGLKREETSSSKDAKSDPSWDPEWLHYRFTLMFQCNQNKCAETVVCIGDGFVNTIQMYDEQYGNYDAGYEESYNPKYFYPPLKIIPIIDEYPKLLVKELNNSFSHFFSDLTSCANKIRICVELLMDEQGINKTIITKHKRRPLSLHDRIELFRLRFPEIGNSLLAIKWIGNSGSHYDTLTKDDILDAYILLDFSLSKLYDHREKAIKKLAKEINKKKAPLSRKRSK